MILSHKIPAGSRLVQTELADRLGVSRTPLREAIRILEQDGLLRVSNGNHTVEVVSFTGDDLVELYEIREVIDGLAARLLARRGLSAEVEKELSDCLQRMSRSVLPLKGEAFFTAHTGFHSAILVHCGNTRLHSELQLVRMTAASLRDEFPRQVRVGKRSAHDARSYADLAIAEHQAVYDAIRCGDEDRAEKVARHHIRHSFDLIPRNNDGTGRAQP
jgi:GntR family transcriptional regulator of vanillate catabolism